MKTFAIAIALVLVGCAKKGDPKACEEAGAAVEARVKTAPPQGGESAEQHDKRAAYARARVTSHCEDDGWSAEASGCVKTSTSPSECDKFLTADQHEKLEITITGSAVGSDMKIDVHDGM
jgi:hypothetical protein